MILPVTGSDGVSGSDGVAPGDPFTGGLAGSVGEVARGAAELGGMEGVGVVGVEEPGSCGA